MATTGRASIRTALQAMSKRSVVPFRAIRRWDRAGDSGERDVTVGKVLLRWRNREASDETRGTERPDLGIADHSHSAHPSISLFEVRIRNVASVPGEGIASVSVVDSNGTTLAEALANEGIAVRVPSAQQGGIEGRLVTFSGSPAFRSLIANLARSSVRFGLQARILTNGGDANQTDNVRTRWWGGWRRLVPGEEVSLQFVLPTVQGRAERIRAEVVGVPPQARLIETRLDDPPNSQSGHRILAIGVRPSQQLPYGSTLIARVTVSDSATTEVLQQYERIAAFDTVPPMISSYRVLMLRDGRIAVQLQANDRHSGVPESGVATQYSLDGGKTWLSQIHDFVEDDFGRAALFETTLGPFSPNARLLIGVCAQDRVGNANTLLPRDASVFASPRNAERAFEAFRVTHLRTDGNPAFEPTSVLQRAGWVRAADSAKERSRPGSPRDEAGALQRFETRRIDELRVVPDSFRAWGVDLASFERLTSPLIHVSGSEGCAMTTALRVEVLP